MSKKSYFASENIFFKVLFIITFLLFFVALYEYFFLTRIERTKYLNFIVIILFFVVFNRRKFKER